jgi:hypothetical protein
MGDNEPQNCDDLDFEGTEVHMSNELDLELEIRPSKISSPETVKLEVINRMETPYRIAPNLDPVVYRKTEGKWQKIALAARFPFPEYVTVSDTYSYEKEIPFSNWKPEPGTYLLLIPGKLLTDQSGEKVNIMSSIELH